jgi:DNA-binding transcriptional MerR regulator
MPRLTGVYMTEKTTLPLATTADMIGIKAGTLRRWAEYHSAHLSSTANPLAGQARRFTHKDVEVLRMVAELRSRGLTVGGINDRLSAITFPDVEESEAVDESTELASVASQEGHHDVAAIIQALSSHQAQIDAIQQATRRRFDTVTVLGIGICIGLLFAVGMIMLAWLYGGAP